MKKILTPQRLGAAAKKLISGSQFATVGALGLVVNQVVLWLLVDVLHMGHLLLSAAMATQASTTFNFIGTESWVFGSRRAGGAMGIIKRFVVYDTVNSTALLIRLPVLQVMTAGLHMNYLVANLLTLVALTLLRFLIADSLIWRGPTLPRRA
ncbi:MAG: GtrA family protein [Chloroflexi bacterium]|nr:MAG: GtrA family protein [Chloroflexota bacterium]